jgi:hypothetical protein
MSKEIIVALTAVIVAICMTFVTLYIYFKDATLDSLRADAYTLFLKAENTFAGTGNGKEKMDFVVNAIKHVMPKWLKLFISDEMLKELLQMWFNNIKDLLDDGKINDSAEVG